MIAQSNVTHMFVGKDLNILANTGVREDLAVGQIGVFKVGSKTANGAGVLAAGDRYTIVTKNQSGVIVESPIITKGSGEEYNVDYLAATNEAKAIGYNGTSGSISAANSTDYVVHVSWKDNSKTYGQSNDLVKFAAYRSDASATQAEIALGIAENFNKNFSKEDPQILKAEILSAEAGDALGTSVDTITLKNGSKYFTADDIDDATGGAALAVGNYLRIGTATSSPIYKITAIDTTNNIGTLSMPYQGVDYSAEDTAFEQVTAADAAAAAAGVKISALNNQKYFEPGLVKYYNTVFDIQLNEDFGTTDTSDLVAGASGSGTYYEVAQNEWFLKGNRGESWRQGNYPKNVKLEATSGKTYDQITITFKEANSTTIDRDVLAFGTVMIATEDASSGNIYASLKTALGL